MICTVSKLSFILAALNFILGRFSISSAGNVNSAIPDIPEIAKYFGTKGRYEEVNPHLIYDILSVNKSLLKPPSADCNAVHLTALIRHGTRYPTTQNVKKMQNMSSLVLTQASGNEIWLQDIKTKWNMWYSEDMDGRLVEKGREDLRHLAVRLATAFPTLISEGNLRGNRIKFMTSSKHRCVDSINSFKQGLKNLWNIEDMEFDHEVNDELMRFFDRCRRFIKDVAQNSTALAEFDLFRSRAEMRSVREKVADRLQIPHTHITTDLVEAAFYLCAYEFAIKTINSPWCRLFDETDAQVLEYASDLKQYWKRGYGHEINQKSSCSLFHDVFNRLDRIANASRFGDVTEAVTVQLGHADTLLPLLSLMGFFRDDVTLTSDNYAAQQNRTYRTSRFMPYAANLVLVMYDCSEGLRLQLLLNEQPLAFPSISHPAPLYHAVREAFQDLLQGCDFRKECEMP
ncbi:multiple inositol polyphosphate phosphatase 1-like [Megalops cyprinoides]|uniref:multiple inositol polyphosphate phosphatase 1-like n=1 Tax=Megalops cyprinoides TaxID=118141 RepID=UPI0018643F38|nr:multiple inositol polyphosphate phosphatase 1-like [Megalops cyprinoides]